MAGKFEIKQSANGKFHFNLKAGNGQIILSSEMYETKSAAENGIESVKKNSADTARFEIRNSTASAKHASSLFSFEIRNPYSPPTKCPSIQVDHAATNPRPEI